MKRRQFLQSSSVLSIPVLLGGIEISAITSSPLFNFINKDNDKVLLLIQLNGGNDGLNMVIPLDQYSGLSQVRPSLIIPESSVLKLVDETGLHPAMSGAASLFKEGQLAVIQSVGYPNQNRSHFRSTDIWTTASDSNQQLSTGWVGRYLNQNHPGFPENYPNQDYPDPLAITMGNVVSETCQGPLTNYSYALDSDLNIQIIEESVLAPDDGSCYNKELSFIKTTIQQSDDYALRLLDAVDKGNNISEYPAGNKLADQLKVVAKLISGGLQTQVYIVNMGGFDTHANQVDSKDHEIGNHANLLKTLSDAITVFMDDLKALGISERVVGMTFSEFGRQIIANNSIGTDHGTAAPVIVFGECINQGVYGSNPDISPDTAPQEGVPMLFDFRSVYASLLIDWMGVPTDKVKQILFNDFQKIPFIKNCQISSTNQDVDTDIKISCYPNPCRNYTMVSFDNFGKYVHLALFDILGSQLGVFINKTLEKGHHEINIDMNGYSAGTYILRIGIDNHVEVLRIIKINY